VAVLPYRARVRLSLPEHSRARTVAIAGAGLAATLAPVLPGGPGIGAAHSGPAVRAQGRSASAGRTPTRRRARRAAGALPTGCRDRGGGVHRSGRGHGKVVALTFDDGPAPDTPTFLGVLEHQHVPATFFEIGRQVAGHRPVLQRMLRDGDAIGNHTYTHPNLLGLPPARVRQELAGTSAAIHSTGSYRPCLFRPPYGAFNQTVVRIARGDGMATILWNVDPRDWSRPGTRAIEQRVLSAVRPGSIVIMHDGGGPRQETLAALPHIIGVLRKRGYRFRTVAGLLGFKPTGAQPPATSRRRKTR